MTFLLFDLTGLRALVTGSSQGIGLALARGLAEHGAEVELNGRDRRKLDAAMRELAGAGARVSASDFDVTDAERSSAASMRSKATLVQSISWSTMPGCSFAVHWKSFRPTAGSSC